MSESLRKTINKISKKDLVSMTVTHIQFLSETHTLLNQIAQTARGDFKDNEDPLEWTLAQLGSLLQNEIFASQPTIASDKTPVSTFTTTDDEIKPTTSSTQQVQPTQPLTSTATLITTTISKNEHLDDDELDSVHFNYNRFPNRQYKLPPNTPMFMADGRTCDDWFFVFENAIQASSVPDHMILPLLSSYVTGTALQLLKLHMNDTNQADWRSFKAILRSTFQPKDHIFRTRQKLVALKQGSDSIDTYNKNF